MDEVVTDPPSFSISRPRPWVLILLTSGFLISLGIFLIKRPALDYLEATALREARARGVIVQVEDSSIGYTGDYFAKSLTLTFPKVFLGFRLSNVTLLPSYLGLFEGVGGAAFSAQVYGGDCKGSLNTPDWGPSLIGSLNCQKVSVSLHPALMGLGVTRGIVDFSFDNIEVLKGTLRKLNGGFALTEAALPRGFKLSLPSGFYISIPPVQKLSLNSNVAFDGTTLSIPEAKYTSNFGQGGIRGKLHFSAQGRATHIEADGDLALTEEGKEHLSPFLLLFGHGKVKSSHVRVHIEGKPNSPLVTVEDI